MTVPEDLFAIATIYNAAVFYYGFGNGGTNYYACLTMLPLRAPLVATRPEREMVIAHLGNSLHHFIRLDLAPDFPVPPIARTWFENREDSVDGWDRLYQRRRDQWDRLARSAH